MGSRFSSPHYEAGGGGGKPEGKKMHRTPQQPPVGVLKAPMPLAAEKLVLPTTFPSYHLASENEKEQKLLN